MRRVVGDWGVLLIRCGYGLTIFLIELEGYFPAVTGGSCRIGSMFVDPMPFPCADFFFELIEVGDFILSEALAPERGVDGAMGVLLISCGYGLTIFFI